MIFNNIYNSKRGISVKLISNGKGNYDIIGIENRIEQIVANLLDNSVSFSEDNKEINVLLNSDDNGFIKLNVIDEEEVLKRLILERYSIDSIAIDLKNLESTQG